MEFDSLLGKNPKVVVAVSGEKVNNAFRILINVRGRAMEELEHFAERLRHDIQTRCGCIVKKRMAKDGTYYLYCPKSFAWVRRVINGQVVPNTCFPIQVREKHATKAGVAASSNRRIPNGWYNEPTLEWHVLEKDYKSYEKTLEVLSNICQTL